MSQLRVASDVGGTFTDSIAYDAATRRITVSKVPTTPVNRAVGTVAGLKRALALQDRTGAEVDYVGHGMTTTTNAVIQRTGARTALLGNKGFRDLLLIGRARGRGMDGVQVSMTNTMNTPIEALKISYPLQVESYELRDESGGESRYRGGQGVERSLRVISHAARASVQADRRVFALYGLHGGADGALGRNSVVAAGGERGLPGKGSVTLQDGDVVVVRTPGGGWGQPAEGSDTD